MRDLWQIVLSVAVVLLSIAVHEFAHAKSADAAGDPTPRLHGRVTLNPLKHLDPLGTIMILMTSISGYGIGWGKPVPVNPQRMRNPRWDSLLVTAWGPFSNILIAVTCALVLRFAPLDWLVWGPLANVLQFAILINLGLAFFNLIPLFPLDGSWILKELLPPRAGYDFFRWNMRFGALVLLGAILVLPMFNVYPLRAVLWPAVDGAFSFLVGVR
jgi:Zn-dependent protease